MKNIYLIPLITLLTGCVAGQEIALHYDPAPPVAGYDGHGIPVSVSVVDARPYVTNQDKDASYLGHYRAGFGNPWDVTNLNEYPLADQLAADLSHELKTLGYAVVGIGPGKAILVTVHDFNFNAMKNGRFWYRINIKVSHDRLTLAESTIKDTAIIPGNIWVGVKYDMEREIPAYYDQIIRALIRANPVVMKALED